MLSTTETHHVIGANNTPANARQHRRAVSNQYQVVALPTKQSPPDREAVVKRKSPNPLCERGLMASRLVHNYAAAYLAFVHVVVGVV